MARKLSDEAIRLIAERFKALSEPTRLKLIMALEHGEKNVSQIVEEVSSTQANISRHLQYLTEAGILKRRKDGLHVYYSISDPRVFDLCQVVCGSLEQHFNNQAQAFK
ncbi:MAG TPA: metalloregulator ArsR/SmtB family transcription factor [Acidobacteriota bacterium]|mgnify:CR=1 FL=1|nr:metalloregulator ArsR/SmtB family transcription factor [Acidobacteriota bacterium]